MICTMGEEPSLGLELPPPAQAAPRTVVPKSKRKEVGRMVEFL